MGEPNLHESTWERAKADADAIYHSTTFYVSEGVVGVIAAGIGILLTADADSTQTQVVVPILAGIIGVLLPLAVVLAAQLATAPRRQRNELRAAWPSGPMRQPVKVRVNLLNYARIAGENSNVLRRRAGHYDSDEEDVARWTNEVVAFLEEHAPDHAEAFIAANNTGALADRLAVRAAKLREIADSLDQ